MPVGADSFKQALQWCAEVFHNLKSVLKSKGYSTAVGDEGGFAPNLKSDEEAFQVILEAITKAGFKPGEDFRLAVDAAATEMYEEAKEKGKEGMYYWWKADKWMTKEEMVAFWEDMCNKYPIISLEDCVAEEDWEAWKILTDNHRQQGATRRRRSVRDQYKTSEKRHRDGRMQTQSLSRSIRSAH